MSDKAPKDQEQKAAEAAVEAFRQDLGPFVVAADTTRMPMVFTDAKKPDNPIIYVNDAFLKLTGYDRDELLAQSFNSLLAEETDKSDIREIAEAYAGKDEDPEIRYHHKDGSTFWATIFVTPVKDKDGEIVQHFVSLVDTTKHQRAREHALVAPR